MNNVIVVVVEAGLELRFLVPPLCPAWPPCVEFEGFLKVVCALVFAASFEAEAGGTGVVAVITTGRLLLVSVASADSLIDGQSGSASFVLALAIRVVSLLLIVVENVKGLGNSVSTDDDDA